MTSLLTLSGILMMTGAFMCSVALERRSQLPVYYLPQRTDVYLYQDDIPAMEQATICLWYKGVEDDDDRVFDFLFSVSEPGGDEDTLTVGFVKSNSLTIWIGYKYFQMTASDVAVHDDVLWRGWNKHCITWRKNGQAKWYTDVGESGQLELVASTAVDGSVTRGDGKFVLFQEQDNYGGGFDVNQAVYGGVAWFNIWDVEKNEEQLNNLGCADTGNVVSMDTLQVSGEPGKWEESFPCIDGVLPRLSEQGGTNKKSRMFCKISGAELNGNHKISSSTVEKVSRCATLCNQLPQCLSANYNQSNGECTLNNSTDDGNEVDFVSGLGPHMVHLTSRECI